MFGHSSIGNLTCLEWAWLRGIIGYTAIRIGLEQSIISLVPTLSWSLQFSCRRDLRSERFIELGSSSSCLRGLRWVSSGPLTGKLEFQLLSLSVLLASLASSRRFECSSLQFLSSRSPSTVR